MPRSGRLHIAGGYYHVLGRGLERRSIFKYDADKEDFLNRLEACLAQTSTECLAWALMSNHYHLLLRVGVDPLSLLMHRLLGGYASYYNRRHRRVGYVFQNRFASILCEQETYLIELIRYIHLNPVRAGLVNGLTALDRYGWSGHSALMGYRQLNWQRSDVVLERFGHETHSARGQYRRYLADGLMDNERSKLFDGGGLIRSAGGWEPIVKARRNHEQRIGDERILGGTKFVEAMLQEDNLPLDSRAQYERNGFNLPELVKIVFKHFGLSAGRVKDKGRNNALANAKGVVCHLATSELGLSQSPVADALGMTQPAVSMARARGRVYCETNSINIDSMLETPDN